MRYILAAADYCLFHGVNRATPRAAQRRGPDARRISVAADAEEPERVPWIRSPRRREPAICPSTSAFSRPPTADASQLAHAGHARHGTLLQSIHGNVALDNFAAEQARQFEIRHKVEAAGQPVAVECTILASARDPDTFDTAAAFDLLHPGTEMVCGTERLQAVTRTLGQFAGLRQHHAKAETRKPGEWRLFEDALNACAGACQPRGHS